MNPMQRGGMHDSVTTFGSPHQIIWISNITLDELRVGLDGTEVERDRRVTLRSERGHCRSTEIPSGPRDEYLHMPP
jgi:hypothetical protein